MIGAVQTKHAASAHPLERLEYDVAMLAQERAQFLRAARYQGGWCAVRKPRRVEFLIGITQALRFVHHQHACSLGALEYVGRVNVLHVERRILTHEYHVQLIQRLCFISAETIPVVAIVLHREAPRPAQGAAVA